jgi:Protein of unknown function (DUF1761)
MASADPDRRHPLLLGAAWYAALAEPWLAAVGKTAQQVPAGSPALYALPVAAALLNAWLVAWMLDRSGRRGALAGVGTGLAVVAATIVPFALVHNAFAGFPLRLTLIDAGLEVVSLAVTGWIVGVAAPGTDQPPRGQRNDPVSQPTPLA